MSSELIASQLETHLDASGGELQSNVLSDSGGGRVGSRLVSLLGTEPAKEGVSQMSGACHSALGGVLPSEADCVAIISSTLAVFVYVQTHVRALQISRPCDSLRKGARLKLEATLRIHRAVESRRRKVAA